MMRILTGLVLALGLQGCLTPLFIGERCGRITCADPDPVAEGTYVVIDSGIETVQVRTVEVGAETVRLIVEDPAGRVWEAEYAITERGP